MDLFNSAFLHSQVFWTGLSFFIVLGFMWWLVLPPIVKVLDERAGKIKTDLDTAEAKRVAAEDTLAQYETKLAKAREEASDILATARVDSKKLVDARLAELDGELQRKRDDANKSIAAAQSKALKDIQGQVAALTVDIAEKLLLETVDTKKAQSLTDKALKDLAN